MPGVVGSSGFGFEVNERDVVIDFFSHEKPFKSLSCRIRQLPVGGGVGRDGVIRLWMLPFVP